jgi:predicted MFS family arabinose efflux permease
MNFKKQHTQMNDSKPGLYPWFIVFSLAIVGCLNYLDRTIIITMKDSVKSAIPMTNSQFGLLTSVFLWVYGIISPFAGFIGDKFSRSRVIVGSLFLWSLVTLLTAFSTTFKDLLATRILMGISEACYMPAAFALIVDYHRNTTRSLATGINLAGVMTGSSLGFLGGTVAANHHWNTIFIYLGILGIAYSILLLFILKDSPREKVDFVEDNRNNSIKVTFFVAIRALFKLRSYLLLVAAWGLCGIATWFVVGWLPTYFQKHFKLSQELSGLYATGYLYPFALIGALLGGFLADRWSKSNPHARILVPIFGLCIGGLFMFFASNTTILSFAIISFMIYSLTRMFFDANTMPILCLIADSHHIATGYGILNLVACIIGGIGLYAGGAFLDSNIHLEVMFQFGGLIMIISMILLILVKKQLMQI